MSRHKQVSEFYELFLVKLVEGPTVTDAYEATEIAWVKKGNDRMYKNFNSFKGSKCYHKKRGQHIFK